MSKEYPCDTCTLKCCKTKSRKDWVDYYMEHQALINAYAEKHNIEPIRPEMTEDPCRKCRSRYYCDVICPEKAAWWDTVRERLKGVWGM